jgi:REP element-mobilizing transposase RayT
VSDEQQEIPLRKHPAHGVLIIDPAIVFVTVCTKHRLPWLANATVHRALQQAWGEAQAWLVGRYVIMPDHIHLFAAPSQTSIELDDWIQFWKSAFTKRVRQTASLDIPARPWQTDHWDTRLRTWQSYDQKWDYVRNNPVRHRLVARAEEWPYQGEIHSLTWD